MNKTVLKVFLVIGVLVLCLVVWALTFNDGGLLQTGYEAIAGPINETWEKLSGGDPILPETWGSADNEGKNVEDARQNAGN